MLTFETITIQDRDWIKTINQTAPHASCEYCFGNLFIWQDMYHTQICRIGGYYTASFQTESGTSFLFPIGTGALKPVIDEMLLHCGEQGIPFKMHSMEEQDKAALMQAFPGKFLISHCRDYDDYVYDVAALTSLSGKKYHGKRNHLARFYEQNWSFEPIGTQNIAECLAMQARWLAQKQNDPALLHEQKALFRAFSNWEALGFFGGLLRVNGEVCAYTIAEELNAETVVIHFEKADTQIPGVYAAINREFLARCCQKYRFVNREDDVGIEGLRRAKLSYHPIALVSKYEVSA
ncbi:DUF2156 domain-containing protein [Phocea massiliensis]|uniref:DUF2156 domain-containing protein n=1 Tax=Merdimmobilis hominis TaxID=2897707 RepID=A0A938X7E7_9FIRM|nr:phosphatidylglycerol lysyltransferase domain-containing protein [Merdimmobilis hominis]MBM6920571.1 DUF2156 domain-containing protein [Merdimmobilis hominis]